MIDLSMLARQRFAIIGLGKSGLATAAALEKAGATILAWDDAPARREEARRAGIACARPRVGGWRRLDGLVMSPGIAHTFPRPHPMAAAARAAGVPIIGDIELLARAAPEARYVAVTGTNGKSTTTSLIGHLLRQSFKVSVGGNLGTPSLALDALGDDGIYVLELSSYQLETAPSLACDIAVLTNITPDHLDRHGGMAGYIEAKRRIFAHPKGLKIAIIGIDDPASCKLREELIGVGRRIVPISARVAVPGGVYCHDGILTDARGANPETIADLRDIPTLPGAHNWQNAAAAYAAAASLGLSREAIVAGLRSFPGLKHRQELVATIEGIRFVNDSKATNADAAAKALVCYEHIYWIAGGRPKEGGIAPLTELFPRIRHAFLIGEASEAFARTLEGKVPFTRAGDLARAVALAQALARRDRHRGAVVLLAPACASFDQFANFEARGEAFAALVRRLETAP